MAQSFTARDTEIIRRARNKRREVLVLREDHDWLAEYVSSPKDLLRRMASRGALIKLGGGRYAIPAMGSTSPSYKAWQPMVDARLAPLGGYYIAGLSALIEHRLTDLSESSVCVLVGFWNYGLNSGEVAVAGRALNAALSRRSEIFTTESGIETVRLSRTERYHRSNVERTLVDCLWHPELCGATETWVTAWGRALTHEVGLAQACSYALVLGPRVACRLGALLEIAGVGEQEREMLAARVRVPRKPALLVPTALDIEDAELMRNWNVRLNISRDRIEGWLAYGK